MIETLAVAAVLAAGWPMPARTATRSSSVYTIIGEAAASELTPCLPDVMTRSPTLVIPPEPD